MSLRNSVHKIFQLNGKSFSSEKELILFSKENSSSLYNFLTDWFSNNDYILVNTSGSTGKPKEIQLKKEYMINSALATGSYFDLKESTTALCCLPIDFIVGKMMLVRALTLGWNLDVIAPSSNPLAFLEKKYDFSAMVPLQLSNSLDKIHQIRKLLVGGGMVPSQLQKSLENVATEVYATYGMTETVTHIAIKKLNHFEDSLHTIEKPLYKTLPNVLISLDERNCLVIEALKVSNEKIITNDVVEISSETEFEWKGRFDNVINSGGVKLHPEEIEQKVSSSFQQRFFVAGIPDDKLGEKLVLIIEGKETPKIREALKYLKKALPKFEVPKKTFFVASFIETETGKIKRTQTLNKILPNL